MTTCFTFFVAAIGVFGSVDGDLIKSSQSSQQKEFSIRESRKQRNKKCAKCSRCRNKNSSKEQLRK